jgi:hypothetical protein
MPRSIVGTRRIAAAPVRRHLAEVYRDGVTSLWEMDGLRGEHGPVAHELRFDADADAVLQDFERWLEPQLAEGEELACLAGWASKLAGAVARIAGILHVCQGLDDGTGWQRPVPVAIVANAIALGRDYLLPHAQAAFGAMGADARLTTARQVWQTICQRLGSEYSEYSESAPPCVSRRDIHQWCRRRFPGGWTTWIPSWTCSSAIISSAPGQALDSLAVDTAVPPTMYTPRQWPPSRRRAPRCTHCTHCTHCPRILGAQQTVLTVLTLAPHGPM